MAKMDFNARVVLLDDHLRLRNCLRKVMVHARRTQGHDWLIEHNPLYQIYECPEEFERRYPSEMRRLSRIPFLVSMELAFKGARQLLEETRGKLLADFNCRESNSEWRDPNDDLDCSFS